MDILTIKIIILVVLGSSTILFSMIPILLRKFIRPHIDEPDSRCSKVISLLSCFAGGVFMATGFLDLFPEVEDAFIKSALGTVYPVAEYLTALGFFCVLIVEQVVMYYQEREPQGSQQGHEDPVNPSRGVQNSTQHFQNSHEGASNHPLVTSTNSTSQNRNNAALIHRRDCHASFRAILLAIALSLHAIFEGLAIGLQPNVNKLLQIFMAVFLHKSVIAFSLGLKLVQSQLKIWTVIKSSLAFCLAAPIGLGLALGLEEYSATVHASIMNGILQGLACGTFFYVTFFEVLPHELNKSGNRLTKTFAILLGFAAVSAVLIIHPDNQATESTEVTLLARNSTYIHLM